MTYTDRTRLRTPNPPCSRGFTLIELIILLAIISILFRFGVPAFNNISHDSRMTAHINTMVTSFNLARSEAVKRNKNIVICPNDDGQCAKRAHWHNGWIMFVDDDMDREYDDDAEEIIFIEAAKSDIEITSSRYRRRVVFRSIGTSAGSNAYYLFCDQRGADGARAVVLSNTGRARVVTQRADGKAWKCSNGKA